MLWFNAKCVMRMINFFNGTAHFEKCKQLFEYQHLLLLSQSFNLYLNVVLF
jgi:hypothetical protein